MILNLLILSFCFLCSKQKKLLLFIQKFRTFALDLLVPSWAAPQQTQIHLVCFRFAPTLQINNLQ